MQCHLIDPDVSWLEVSHQTIGDTIDLRTFTDFRSARDQLLEAPPRFLATNLRLGPYNGLHLVHLASIAADTRCLVFTDRADLALIREAQRIGAFYEDASRVAGALPSYVNSLLPERDRRSPERFDRRQLRRGSRRSADRVRTHPRG
jgi:ActR/RegA family two-component response regulator